MRLLRGLLLLIVFGCIAWVLSRSVSIESSDDQVRITIDRHQLKQAGSDLKSKSRQAVGKMGRALEQAGQSMDEGADEEAAFFQR